MTLPPIATKKTTQWFRNVVKEFLYELQSQICQGRIAKKTTKWHFACKHVPGILVLPCKLFALGFDIRNKKNIIIIINCNPEWMPGSKLVVGTYLYYYYLASKITSSKFKPYKEKQKIS